jgi:hypothetical protein
VIHPPNRPGRSTRQNVLVTIGVVEDAAGTGIALPRLAVALRAATRRYDDIIRLKTAATALKLKDPDAFLGTGEGIVGGELAL